ncbi:DUF3105 domain-containing protein [Phytohabitans suffuscus]|uniref:DUF3105 domain-containing protein n=1 Tax=Phytohabitans suffuscus TaxID=624315 RepID=A0A6F8YF10_9ACTN|nr:DUF3105 domain-containing protein [Phytohabitans suffuscus]BCB84682.1 hypothetical protein Psuf_019950 [Phytohabitans suffuscus]
MSVSTPAGDQRRPSVVSTGKKAPAGSAKSSTAAKSTSAAARKGTSSGGKGGGAGKGGGGKGPRKPITPVKVSQGRNWGPIGLFVAVGVLAVAIVGYGAYAAFQGSRSWEDRAADIDGIVNYREEDPSLTQGGQHVAGKVEYTVNPPVGGQHNNDWQNCMGDVYDAPIASEHAVHSLEHGAVWITYRPDLPQDQVDTLAAKVRGTEKLMLSPFEGLDSPISLQAWGYQLKVDNAGDSRIDAFIKALRVNASVEGPTALCAQGITATGTEPRNLQPAQQGG